jgi:hypothetical protein
VKTGVLCAVRHKYTFNLRGSAVPCERLGGGKRGKPSNRYAMWIILKIRAIHASEVFQRDTVGSLLLANP